MTATVAISPQPKLQFNQGGLPLAGGLLFSYYAGTTNKAPTYTDSTGATPNANPIVLNANGEANVYLTTGVLYKFTLSPSTDTDPPANAYWSVDNLYCSAASAIPYADAGGTADAITATYVVTSPVLVDGYFLIVDIATTNATTTPTFAPTLNGVLQTATTIVKSVGNVNVALDAGDLQGKAELIYDLQNLVWVLQNPALANAANTANRTDSGEVTVTAAATTGDIFAAAANSILWDDATGSINCTIFPNAAKAGMVRQLRCNGATKFTAGANLLIEGIKSGATIALASGALCEVRAITTTQFKMTYSASGTFTATGTGFTAAPTPTALYRVENGLVNISIQPNALTGTSNANTFTITGLPAVCDPASGGSGVKKLAVMDAIDNGSVCSCVAYAAGTGTINLYKNNYGTVWTTSGTKTLVSSEFSYMSS